MKFVTTLAVLALLASPAMADQPPAAPQLHTVADDVNAMTGDIEISVANLRTYGRQLSNAMGSLQQQIADKDKQIAALEKEITDMKAKSVTADPALADKPETHQKQ